MLIGIDLYQALIVRLWLAFQVFTESLVRTYRRAFWESNSRLFDARQ